MSRRCLIRIVLVLIACVAMPGSNVAQEQDANVDKTLESVRADLRAEKVTIVTEAMDLQPGEADKFWPVYREYEVEVAKLNDRRIALLKDYVAKFATLTDSEAKAMAEKFFDWESSRTQLRKAYFSKFMNATSAITAAKFFQVDHRLDLLVDLQVASEIPGLFVKKTSSTR